MSEIDDELRDQILGRRDEPLANDDYELFAKLVGCGIKTQLEAHKEVWPRSKAKDKAKQSSKIACRPEVAARIKSFVRRRQEILFQDGCVTKNELGFVLSKIIRHDSADNMILDEDGNILGSKVEPGSDTTAIESFETDEIPTAHGLRKGQKVKALNKIAAIQAYAKLFGLDQSDLTQEREVDLLEAAMAMADAGPEGEQANAGGRS